MTPSTILLVDDEEGVRIPIRRFLAQQGYQVVEAAGLVAAADAVRKNNVDAALVDFTLPDGDGMEVFRSLRVHDATLPVVLLTGNGTIDLAVRAIREGVDHFLTKPVELPALTVILERSLEARRLRRVALVGKSSQSRQAVDPFFGESPAIRKLATDAARIASSTIPVLVQGETGTGKGVLARWLHQNGPRADEAFVDLNCAGLSRELLESELFGHEKGAFTGAVATKPGLLEMAHRGTLFLDEIGDVDLQVQAKLLKVVEDLRFRRLGDVRDRQVDVRLIAATHRDLGRLVQEQKFREDLFYRISAIPVLVPPLRDRGADIAVLAHKLVERIGSEMGRPGMRLSPDAERALLSHPWPGNVRQLRNVLERAVLLSDHPVLLDVDLGGGLPMATGPAHAGTPGALPSDPKLTLAEAERRHIEAVLRQERGHVPRAAEVLGLSRSALYERIKKHAIVVPRTSPS